VTVSWIACGCDNEVECLVDTIERTWDRTYEYYFLSRASPATFVSGAEVLFHFICC